MSGTLAPTNEQQLVNFSGLDAVTDKNPQNITKSGFKKEYVAGGFYGSNVNLVLSNNTDAISRKFGAARIEEMLRDPEIAKCLKVIKIGVLGDGVVFYPAVSKPIPLPPKTGESDQRKKLRLAREQEIERYELSKQYADFANRAINNIDSAFCSTVLDNMLDALHYGNKVAEQTYREEFDKNFNKTVLTLDSIRVKSHHCVRFVLNKYRKLIGFHTIVRKENNDKEVILPREKFIVLTFNGKNGDPRGNSILESVHNAWWLKKQLWPEYLRWLLQCAIPGLVGYTSDKTEQRKFLIDADTNEIIKDAQGNPIYESEVDDLLNALIQLRNASAIALPAGSKVEPINNTVSGDPFKGMRDVLNEEIEMGIILQTLATSEGRHQSRAAAQSHLSILDLLIWAIKGLVIDMIRQDLLLPLMEINFADFDRSLLPLISMGDTERRDFATDAIAIATLWKSGFMGESQKIGFDKQLGAPERDEESDRASLAQAQTQEQTKQSNTSTPNPKVSEKLANMLAAYESMEN